MVWRNCKASIGASAICSHMLEAEGHAADFLVEGEARMVAASQAARRAAGQVMEAEEAAVAQRPVEAEQAITRVAGQNSECEAELSESVLESLLESCRDPFGPWHSVRDQHRRTQPFWVLKP